MVRWYSSIIRELNGLGDKIFIHDPVGFMDDMNLQADLSRTYSVHEYQSDFDLYQNFSKHPEDKLIIFSKTRINRQFIKDNFKLFEITAELVFPGLDPDLIGDVDVSYYQQVYDYYSELKSQGKSMDTQHLILKSVWDVDVGELYSPTKNLKIALSFLIENKDIPNTIMDSVSQKLNINIFELKKDREKFLNWMKTILEGYVHELEDNNDHRYDLSMDLIQFYLSKLDFKLDFLEDEIIDKEPWLSRFKMDKSEENLKEKIKSDISTFELLLQRYLKEELDLNQVEDMFYMAKLFCQILYNVQINGWPMKEYINIQSSYKELENVFRKLLDDNKFELLFRYPYNKRPFTVDKILYYINHNFKKEDVALIVMDGMSYDEWFVFKESLNHFDLDETESFAVLPSITSFSRTSIFSGKTPREFLNNKKISQKAEKEGFYSFLTSKGYKAEDILYGHIDLNDNVIKTGKDEIQFHHLKGYKFLGLICNLFDELSHQMSIYGDLKSNLYKNIRNTVESSKIVQLIEELYSQGYRVIITSDHGNVFSKSNRIISNKNLEFERRKSNRCLIFDNELFADSLIFENPKCFKYQYKVIGNDLFLVFSNGNSFFSNKGGYSITHGGILPEEWVVPLVVLK